MITHLLSSYGYAAVFSVVMLESAGIPMPGETILVSASIYASAMHGLDIRLVIGAAAAGAIVGDNLGYWIGREFGQTLLDRWGPKIGLDARKRKLGQYLFMKQGGAIVFLGRFVALLRAYAALLAGVNAYPAGRFFLFNAAGGLVWASVFGLGGYLMGKGIDRIAGPIGWAALAAAIVGAVFVWRFYKMHEERLLDEAERAMGARGAPRVKTG
jgi:membrane protein DedA with SNARE-associated domain